MFPTINAEYLAAKRADAANRFILESVLDVEETLPGSDEEMESIVDPDSVPDDVYAKIDKELDKIVDDPNYDDTEAEEMLDDDFDVDDISDAEIDAIMDEAVATIERKAKVASVFANLSEKAGNTMDKTTGMGLLKTLSESVNQFHNGKMSDPIGKAYEPVETPKGSIDETKLENEALRESAVDAALARYHAIVEAANPDVEDFPGKEGTTTADGETPAGMPEPNGNEDGNNVGGDDEVVDKEAREVEVEDGGDDAIDVIKANEAASRYAAIAESAKASVVNGSAALDESLAEAKDHLKAAKGSLRSVFKGSTSKDTAKANAKEALHQLAQAAKAAVKRDDNKNMEESVTNPDVEDFPGQTGAGNDHGEKEGALPQGQEPADFPNSTGDKRVNSGDVPTNRYKTVVEAVTMKDVEDFPKAEGTHSAEGNGVPAGMSHTDESKVASWTDESDAEKKDVGVEDGGTDAIDVIKANEAVTRFRTITEAAKAKKGVCPKCGKDPCECKC